MAIGDWQEKKRRGSSCGGRTLSLPPPPPRFASAPPPGAGGGRLIVGRAWFGLEQKRLLVWRSHAVSAAPSASLRFGTSPGGRGRTLDRRASPRFASRRVARSEALRPIANRQSPIAHRPSPIAGERQRGLLLDRVDGDLEGERLAGEGVVGVDGDRLLVNGEDRHPAAVGQHDLFTDGKIGRGSLGR